jgi:hypothetical protein
MKCYRNEYGHKKTIDPSIHLSQHIDREPNISGCSVLDIGYIKSERDDNERYIRDLQNAIAHDRLLC